MGGPDSSLLSRVATGDSDLSPTPRACVVWPQVILVPFLEALQGSRLHWSVWIATALACTGTPQSQGSDRDARRMGMQEKEKTKSRLEGRNEAPEKQS